MNTYQTQWFGVDVELVCLVYTTIKNQLSALSEYFMKTPCNSFIKVIDKHVNCWEKDIQNVNSFLLQKLQFDWNNAHQTRSVESYWDCEYLNNDSSMQGR